MMFDNFINRVKTRLELPLPGVEAQFRLARAARAMSVEVPDNARIACVLVLFYPVDTIPHLVLIERQSSDNPNDQHAGQISFPGGKSEKSDLSLAATALREAEEEIGVAADSVAIIGRLTELYIPVSNFLVHPFVGYTAAPPGFVLQKEEVHSVLEVPVPLLKDDAIRNITDIRINDGLILKEVPCFEIQDRVVWGATAMMLSELLAIL